MEQNKIPKEIIDNIPNDLFLQSKTRKQLKQFYSELKELLKSKGAQPISAKNEIILLIRKIFSDKYRYFIYDRDKQSLELFIYTLCNQIEVKISKMVEGYKSFYFTLDYNIDKNNNFNDNTAKNQMINFLISFYDFFEDEIVIDNNDIMNTIIQAHNTNNNIQNKNQINESFIFCLLKTVNILNSTQLAKNEFNNIFKSVINGPNSNYYSLYDLGYLLIKTLESLSKIKQLSNLNNDKNSTFIKITYNTIMPILSEFFANVILDYNMKSLIGIIVKKEDFAILFNELSQIRIVRNKLVTFLSNSSQILANNDQDNLVKKTIIKHKTYDKIIKHILNDLNNNIYNIKTVNEMLYELKQIIIFYVVSNIPSSYNFEENITLVLSKTIAKLLVNPNSNRNIKINTNNYENSVISIFVNFINNISDYNRTVDPDNKYKIYNLLIYIFREISNSNIKLNAVKGLLGSFIINLEEYQDMIGKTQFLNSFIGNLYKCNEDIINYFFETLFTFYNNFYYVANMELTNLITSLVYFETPDSINVLIRNLKKFNLLITRSVKNHISENNNKNKGGKKNFFTGSNNNNSSSVEFEEKLKLLEEINQNFIDILFNIIKEISSNNNNNNNNKSNIFSVEMTIPLLDYAEEIIKNKITYEYFINKNFFSFFHSLTNKEKSKLIAYKILEIVLKTSIDKEQNEACIKLILNRYQSLNSIEQNESLLLQNEISKLKELLLMYKSSKITFLYETLSIKSQQKNLNERIVSFLFQYFDYVEENKSFIIKIYNNEYHKLFKEYINILLDIIIISNENSINKINITSPKLKLEHFNKIINDVFNFMQYITKNNIPNNEYYLFDIIIYFIDKALNLTTNNNNIKIDQYIKDQNITSYYINKFKIPNNLIENNIKVHVSNFFVHSHVIIITLLKALLKNNLYLGSFLNFIHFISIINENNIVFLLKQNLLYILLKISMQKPNYNKIILKIFQVSAKFLEKDQLRTIFEYLIQIFNNNQNKNFAIDIINCLNKTLNFVATSAYEYAKGICLSNYLIKQPNIYNTMNINDINLTSFIDSKIIIKQEIFFRISQNDGKLILFRLEKEFFNNYKNKQFLEIAINNNNLLTVGENDPQLQFKNISISKQQISKENVEINISEFLNNNDINIFLYTFDRSENILSININGKNIVSYEYSFSFPIKNTNTNKENINNGMYITIGYPIENIIDVNDDNYFIFPTIKLLSVIIKIEENQEIKKIYKLKINDIKLINKPLSGLTHYKLDEDTVLISKYDSYDFAKINNIYYNNNTKWLFYKNIFFIDNYLAFSFDFNFRLEKYIFILLNNNNLDKDIFKLLINLLSLYFMINSRYLLNFLCKEEIISTMYFIIYKWTKFIDKEIIELLFSALLSYDKCNFCLISEIFLDFQIFKNLNVNSKVELLNLIERKILLDTTTLDISLLEKLTNLLVLCPSENENNINIDEMIINILLKFLELNNNKNPKINENFEKLFILLFNFKLFIQEHLTTYNKGQNTKSYNILKNYFKKMFDNNSIANISEIIKKKINSNFFNDNNLKNKILQLCNSNSTSTKSNTNFNDNNKENNTNNNTPNKNYNNDLSTNNSKMNNNDQDDIYEMKGTITGKNESWINLEKPYVIQVKFYVNSNEILCNADCVLCKTIKKIIKYLFLREMKYNIFETYMLQNYTETYMLNINLDYKINFSYYLMRTEGFNRIRKKFHLLVDKITTKEIDRSTSPDKKNNYYTKLFEFYKKGKYSDNLCTFFNMMQIFNVVFVEDCVEENDKFQGVFNCLFFKESTYINSVLVLGRDKIYLLTNVNISEDLILYNAINPINKNFWVIENYSNLLEEQCQFLDLYDYINNNKDKSSSDKQIFDKEDIGFRVYSFHYKEINELHKKRFLHQNNAIEIFLKNGDNYYLAFNIDQRDNIVNKILQYLTEAKIYRSNNLIINPLLLDYKRTNSNQANPSNLSDSSLSNISNNCIYEISNYNSSSLKNENLIFIRNNNLFIEKETKYESSKSSKIKKKSKNKNKKNIAKITDTKEILEQAMEKWSDGFISTYSYLMILNTLSGRTYNNLAQYPVFPWILKDYFSTNIDLNESNTYRDFCYPIYAQDEESRENLKLKYESFEDTDCKYHSGSHYSNCGFVCYFLVRVKPFSNIAAEIQGNCFDTPDRLFFNIQNFYKVQEKYQELIPDIFNIPELYININNYDYGKTTDGIKVLDVSLPPWSSYSPRLFSKMNKKALESQYVSQHINDWIDLIFGYKQKGPDAEKYYNVLREVCSFFNPKNCEDENMIEAKINELSEMGIDPIQLFTKAHSKREKHQVMKAFFGKSVFLTYFKPKESCNFFIKNFHNSSKIHEVYKYYEKNYGILSHGEGGMSSFRITYENDPNYMKGKFDDSKDCSIYFIIGNKKTLLPPSYKNFIEWEDKNCFSIIKPFKNIKYNFKIKHMKKHIIKFIKTSSDGKFIILGYENGIIEKYKLRKIFPDENSNNNVIQFGSSNSINNISNTENNEIVKKSKKNKSKGKLIIKSIFGGLKKINKKMTSNDKIINITTNLSKTVQIINPDLNNDLYKRTSSIYEETTNLNFYNSSYIMGSSNKINSDCILLNNKNCKFKQYNSESEKININSSNNIDIDGYYAHSMNSSELKSLLKSNSSSDNQNKQTSYYVIFLINSSSRILNEIYLLDICDSFNFMLVVDKMNNLYIYDFNSFDLLRYVKISSMFSNQIKFSSICPYTGDFILSSSRNVALFNINGVFLSQMYSEESKINSCFITLIPMKESDIFLFTGHKNGFLLVSKLVTNNFNIKENSKDNKTKISDAYHEAFNTIDNNYEKYLDNNNLSLIFDTVIKIKCTDNPIRYIKLTEDLTEVICIDNTNKLIYLTYEDFFDVRKKNKKKVLKNCPMCQSPISSSKTLCHICGKKLCSNCKIERIVPEYSLKNPKAICEDCLQLINSSNKMLYDF